MTRTCVLHPNRPEALVCIVGSRNGGAVRDFCADCIEAGEDDDNFGRCYECADGDHARCIGVPCQCECPPTPIEVLDAEIANAVAIVENLKHRRAAADPRKESDR